jgi:lactoylglutathione lyase
MKLNHLNLTVTNVAAAATLLETYFGLRNMGGGTAAMAGLVDDDGLVLTVMRAGHGMEVKYPASFHVGFMQDSDEQVNDLNRRLKADGFTVDPPRRLHGAWTFYFQAPGGFVIEVGH